MKSMVQWSLSLAMVFTGCIQAQKKTDIPADPAKWKAHEGEAFFNNREIHLVNKADVALLWIDGMEFSNGVVELDIKGKNDNGNSFLGLAFHALNDTIYDAVYFRPFNFSSEEKKANAIQYIDAPGNEWHILRKNFPGKYENAITPVPDPNNWFHVKYQFDYPVVKVFINGSAQPTFEVEQISKRTTGKLGLWIDSDDGWFKNVQVTKTKE